MAVAKKPSVKKPTSAKPASPAGRATAGKGLSIKVVDATGKAAGSITLPEALFGVKGNKQLMAQAVRVYLANQRVGQAKTKTRGEVEGSTRKIYKQKGTGRARHGAIRAPIFVGGGIVFGPVPRDYSLAFPQKMKHAALASALSTQLVKNNILVVTGLGDIQKTKAMAAMFKAIGVSKSALLVVPKDAATVVRAARNIENVDCIPATDLHTYGVLKHDKVVFMKEAMSALGRSAAGGKAL